jgi:predicted permease
MPIIGEWTRRIWYFLNRRRFERELEREMASHRAQMADPRQFGSPLKLREQAADVWGWTWIDDLQHDLRFGIRQLRRAPGFAAIAILSLTLGIGANVAAVSIINGDFFVYPPLRDPSSVRTIEWRTSGPQPGRGRQLPYRAFHTLTQAQSLASAACASGIDVARFDLGNTAWAGPVQHVTGDYFRTLGVTMQRGRPLAAADERGDAAPVAIISDAVWRRRLQSAPDVVGRVMMLEGAPVTIVGVTPPGFYASASWRRVDVTAVMPRTGEGGCQPIVRLRPGVTDEQARREATLLLQRFIADAPSTSATRLTMPFALRLHGFGRGIDEFELRRLRDEAPAIAAASFLLAALVLIPCANVAGIMLARAVTRQREITTRLAVGAGRGRIVRQLLTEGFLLSSIAGVLGVVVCQLLWLAMRDRGPVPVVVDVRVLLYSAGLCVATALGFGLAPALRATRIDLASTMRDSSTGGFGRSRLATGKVLTGVQVVLASLLLIGTAVQVRALTRLMAPRGIEPERVTLIQARLETRDGAIGAVRTALNDVAGLTGIEVAAAIGHAGLTAAICDDTVSGGQDITVNIVSPGFLAATRIPLRTGRDLNWNDDTAVVINQSLARRLFGERNPIGRTVRFGHCEERLIVGMAADSNNAIGADFASGNGTEPTAYLPLSSGAFDLPIRSVTLLVRAGAAPVAGDTLIRAVREVGAIDVGTVQTQAQLLDNNRRGLRNASSLLAGVTLLMVFQAAYGLYAVLTHFVSRRTPEIGIRSVLGATPLDVMRLVVRQSLAPVGIGLGLAVGLTPVAVAVLANARLTAPLDAADQIGLLVPVVAVLLVAFAVACTPAWRAARIAPALAVRAE